MIYLDNAAILSPCGLYRYSLRRTWTFGGRLCNWIMLNPSTADATKDDATVRKCVGFAHRWGYGGIIVTNLFALRATDPRKLRKVADPVVNRFLKRCLE